MDGNGKAERLRQLERRADDHDALIRQHGEACTVARLDIADRLGRIETVQTAILDELRRRTISSARVTAALITGGLGVVAAVVALLV